MPFLDKSTLVDPAYSWFPGQRFTDTRDPTSSDYKNFNISCLWINLSNHTAWLMVGKTATSGTWIQAASTGTGILTLTGDTGGAVGADGANNVNLLGSGAVAIAGNPGTNTLTVSVDGTVATRYEEDAGFAIPSAGILNIVGTGGVNTIGAGNTVFIHAGDIIPTTFTEDAGSAQPISNNLNIFGAGGIFTSGATDTVTIGVTGDVPLIFVEDVGSATATANSLNVLGGTGINTSGAGDTITINADGSTLLTTTENSGTATPAVNNLNILGKYNIFTIGSGATCTIQTQATYRAFVVGDSPVAVNGTDYYLACDTSGGAITIQLPNAPDTGRQFVVKDHVGSAATNAITVTTAGGIVTIDGATTFTMNSNYQSNMFLFNGTSYEVN